MAEDWNCDIRDLVKPSSRSFSAHVVVEAFTDWGKEFRMIYNDIVVDRGSAGNPA
jgi:hypothetical protein